MKPVPVARARRLIEAAEDAARAGSFTKAISLFKTAMRLDPHHPAAHLDLCALYLALEMDAEAERAAREALTRAVAAGDRANGVAALSFLLAMKLPADPH